MSGTRVAFEKWEGLGNDFVLIENADERAWSDERVHAVCERRRGVGADGVLFVERGGAGQPPRMIVRNADGSRPEMCGNGIRCVAGYLAARGTAESGTRASTGSELAGAKPPASARATAEGGTRTSTGGELAGAITIATDAGPKRCEVRGEDGSVDVAVDMGAATIGGRLVVEIEGQAHAFTRGDVGNPHAVTFEPYDEAAIERVGPRVATFPPGGTNVEFCRLVRGEEPWIEVVVWERGVGRTLACGTGACAVASAACAAGLWAYGTPVRVRLPGGELVIVIDAATFAATMRGPARRVFVGELETP
jgi:diaminopimelate epimerase